MYLPGFNSTLASFIMKTIKRWARVARIFAVVFILSCCVVPPAAPPTPPPLEKVTLQLKWLHQFQFAGYYAALQQGYFREAGLDVTIVPGGPGIDVDKEVLTGRADYGVLASELVVKYSQGEPLTSLAPFIQHSIRALMVRKGSGIESLNDLQGKKIALTMNENPEILAMLFSEGISPDNLQIEAQNLTSEERFLNGEIDAVVGSIANQPYQFRLRGVEVNTFRPINYGVDFYGDTLFTSQQKVKENPAQVSKFLRASQLGWEYAFEHPQEVTDLILTQYAPDKLRDQLLFEADVLKDLTEPTLVEVGHQNPGRWQHIADVYSRLKLIQPMKDWRGFIYDPEPHFDIRWVYWISSILLAAIFTLALILIWNMQLRREVKLRTNELVAKNSLLQGEILERQEAEERIRQLNEVLDTRVKERTVQLEASNKELEAFAYSVSHDLRAPLRAIDGFSNILLQKYDQQLDEDGKRILGIIFTNTQKMDHLITDLLALSRASRSRFTYSLIDMTALVHSIYLEIVPPEVQQKFEFKVSNLPAARGDPTLIRQVWTNLISNAVKYTLPKEKCRIEIDGYEEDGALSYLIRDNGVGFDPRYMDKLFGVFQRLHKESEFEGTGVGLAIVQRIIQRHGGRVWAVGQVDKGAAFYFTIPTRQE